MTALTTFRRFFKCSYLETRLMRFEVRIAFTLTSLRKCFTHRRNTSQNSPISRHPSF